MQKPQITLILPAYNEAKHIERTVHSAISFFEMRGLEYEIIVSADGNDGTREIVSNISKSNSCVSVIGSPERRGKGYGIRQAVSLARGEIIGFADADNKTPISELDKFLPHLRNGCDIVIGSRGQRDSVIERRQPWYRQVGSKGFGIFMHLVVGLWDIVDTQCGFKFFRADAIRDLFSLQVIDGYMFDVEILYLAFHKGYKIMQLPVRWRDDGDSRLELLRGNIKNFADVLQIRFNSYGITNSVTRDDKKTI